jgi:hypothetical protein
LRFIGRRKVHKVEEEFGVAEGLDAGSRRAAD